MFNLLLISIAAAAGLGSSESVSFVDEQATMRLELAKFDLNSAAEARRLHHKIVWAAGKVCNASIPGALQLELFACEKDTIADAQRQLDRIIAQRKSGNTLVASLAVTAAVKR